MQIINITTSFDRKKCIGKYKKPIEANTFASFSIAPNANASSEINRAFEDNVKDNNKIIRETMGNRKEEKKMLESYVSSLLDGNPFV